MATINIPPASLAKLSALQSTTIFVTGGSGFVGSHIVTLLVQARVKQVIVFDLRLPKVKHESSTVTYVEGSLESLDDQLAATAKSSDIYAVIHVASPSPVSNNADLFNRINVGGTANVIDMCRKRKIQRLVYTSSASVVFDGTDQQNFDESVPAPMAALDSYTQSKYKGEQLILQANDSKALATVALRPHSIFGVYPTDPYPVTNLVAAALANKSKYQVGAGRNLVDWTYVENVAYAHCLAAAVLTLQHPAAGKTYFITNSEPVFFWDLPRAIYRAMNVPTPYIHLPVAPMLFAARMIESVAARFPALTPSKGFSTQGIKYQTTDHYYNDEAAERDLGYIPPVPFSEGIRRVQQSVKSVAKPPTERSRRISFASFIGTIFMLLIAIATVGSSTTRYIASFIGAAVSYWLYKESTFGEAVNMSDTKVSLAGKRALITGGNRGIGLGTAVGLAKRGAYVVIATRDSKRGDEAVERIKRESGSEKVGRVELDLASFESVDQLTKRLQQQETKFDMIICNAAAMTSRARTVDGLDLQFQANYLSHALLILQCIDRQLLNKNARLVSVSSLMHKAGYMPDNLDNIKHTDIDKAPSVRYNRLQMYNNTKLYQIVFNNELHRRLKLHQPQYLPYNTLSVHPGAVNTEFIDHFIPVWFHSAGNFLINAIAVRTAEQGCESSIYAATAPQLYRVSGVYIDNCRTAVPSELSRDEKAGRALWKLSMDLLGKYAPTGELYR